MFTVGATPTLTTAARLITKFSVQYTSGHTLEISSDPYANLITEHYTS